MKVGVSWGGSWLDFYFIDGDWKNSILFFYPLHGARAVENPLNSASSPTCVYALLITLSVFVAYLVIRKMA